MDSPLTRFCRKLQSVARLFRFVEFFIALAFFTWLSSPLPFAVKISGEYCRRFSLLIFSPISIFLLGNAIVLTLLAKSGLLSSNVSYSIDNAVTEFCEELRSQNPDETSPSLEEEIVFQDKEIICEEKMKSKPLDDQDVFFSEETKKKKKASYQRSQSENLRFAESSEEKENVSVGNQKLRRSETDIFRKDFAGEGDVDKSEILPEENMSNEEFQRTIEAFIAKQIRFHREERLAVVLHGQA